jgi:hypothetical protein
MSVSAPSSQQQAQQQPLQQQQQQPPLLLLVQMLLQVNPQVEHVSDDRFNLPLHLVTQGRRSESRTRGRRSESSTNSGGVGPEADGNNNNNNIDVENVNVASLLELIQLIYQANPGALFKHNLNGETPLDVVVHSVFCPNSVVGFLQQEAFAAQEEATTQLLDEDDNDHAN